MIFNKIWWQVGMSATDYCIEYCGNLNHVTFRLGLRLWLTFHIIPGKTVLQLG